MPLLTFKKTDPVQVIGPLAAATATPLPRWHEVFAAMAHE